MSKDHEFVSRIQRDEWNETKFDSEKRNQANAQAGAAAATAVIPFHAVKVQAIDKHSFKMLINPHKRQQQQLPSKNE